MVEAVVSRDDLKGVSQVAGSSGLQQHLYVIMYPGCIEFEVMLAAELCNKKFPTRVVTPTGKGHRGSNGIKIEPDGSLEEIDLDRCAGILIPGGDPYDLIEGAAAETVGKLLVSALERSILIGAICAAAAVLGKHGLLKTRKFTHGYGNAHKKFLAPLWEGATFTDSDMEIDGGILTAKPEAHIDFAVQFAKHLGAIESDDKRDQLSRYYKNQKPLPDVGLIDHVTIAVRDINQSKRFYQDAFVPLGYKLSFGEEGVFWAFDVGAGLFEFRQARQGEPIGSAHVAFRVRSHELVRAFHAAAIEAGATDNGAPGPRPEYTENYFACFVRDPDGHNIDAMFDVPDEK